MRNAFQSELRLQRQRASGQIEAARIAGDEFLAVALQARIDELDELASRHSMNDTVQ